MDFSSAPPSGNMSTGDKEKLMDQVKQQIALANAQELLQVAILYGLSRHCVPLNVKGYSFMNFR
jgi:hypothetical protein